MCEIMYAFHEMMFQFPYKKINKAENIILYGLGNVGMSYWRQIQDSDYCNVVFAVDKNWEEKHIAGLQVKAPSAILQTDYRVVVSVAQEDACAEILEELSAMNVRRDRIVTDIFISHIPTYRLFEADITFKTQMIKIRDLLKIHSVPMERFVRSGKKGDGGYLMLVSLSASPIAYSFGIDHDVSWDADMAVKGYDVYMYDHTVDALPEQNEKFHFFKVGIADSFNHAADVDTLDNLLRKNGHQNQGGMVLKMDVEGAEWGFIDITSEETLSRFDQIIFEMHGFLQTSNIERIYRALEKLNRTHGVVHVHMNNISNYISQNGCAVIADCLEVTYASKKKYDLIPVNTAYLPIEDDSPCDRNLQEPSLGNWNDSTWF